MPNSIDATGIHTATRQETVDRLNAALRTIYGDDVNLEPNSPDGNLVNVLAQIATDYAEFCATVYAMQDPDQAFGVNLDRVCAINGLPRNGGTRTTQLVTVTVSQALTIAGLDTAPSNPFTVSDASGNQFQLVEAHAFGGAGSADLSFQSARIGAVIVAPNSLTNIVSVQLGVVSVTNGVLAGTIGTNEESDAAYRLRRSNSVEIPSKGFLDGLYGALLAIDGVSSARVLQNVGPDPDANGIPGHSIWVIVDGGADAAVGQAIYVKRNFGPNMKGAVSVVIAQVDGTTFTVKFDRAVAEDLWISFDIAAVTGPAVDDEYLRTQILAGLSYTINEQADASTIVAMAKAIYPNASVSSAGVSATDGSYVTLLSTTSVINRWATAAARLKINGTPG